MNDLSNNKLITAHKCGICGKTYNAQYMKFDYDTFFPVYDDSNIRLKRRVDDKVELFTSDLCPKCSDKILNFIKELQVRGD